MRIWIRLDQLIFGPPDPGSVIFSHPDPDPTCNNGFIKLFSSLTKYNPRVNKFKHNRMVYNIEFYA